VDDDGDLLGYRFDEADADCMTMCQLADLGIVMVAIMKMVVMVEINKVVLIQVMRGGCGGGEDFGGHDADGDDDARAGMWRGGNYDADSGDGDDIVLHGLFF